MTGEKWLRSGNVIADDTRGKSYAAYFNSREEQESATLVLSGDRSLGSVYIHCNRKTLAPKMYLLTKNNTSLICLSLSPLTSNKCYIFQLIINSCCTIFVGKCTLTMGTTLSGLSFSVQFSTPQFLLVFCVLDQSGAMFFWEAEQPKHRRYANQMHVQLLAHDWQRNMKNQQKKLSTRYINEKKIALNGQQDSPY